MIGSTNISLWNPYFLKYPIARLSAQVIIIFKSYYYILALSSLINYDPKPFIYNSELIAKNTTSTKDNSSNTL